MVIETREIRAELPPVPGLRFRLESLRRLRDRGMTSAWLGVHADNPNSALDLYRSCGFEVCRSTTAYRRPLDIHRETT